MKKNLRAVASLLALLLAVPAAQAELSVGVVDMNKIFSSYYKTKDAEAKINEARTTAKNDLDTRMASYKEELEAINKLNQEMQRAELSEEMKAEKARERDEKIAEVKSLEREINEFRATREKQLQEQAVRMRNGIVEEITEVVRKITQAKGYDLVFDSSGSTLNGVPVLIHSSGAMDFSEEVIQELNANKPGDS